MCLDAASLSAADDLSQGIVAVDGWCGATAVVNALRNVLLNIIIMLKGAHRCELC